MARRPEPAARPRREERADEGGFAAIYINVGSRDGAQKGDLVGAIAGESGISSDRIGRITLRDTFSIVEISSGAMDQVLEAINGKTIRGRIISARPDRMVDERPTRGRPERGEGRPFERSREGGARGRPSAGRGGPPSRGGAGGPRSGTRTAGTRGAGAPRRGGRDETRRSRDDFGGPRTFRDDDRSRAPRVTRESREWGERGERLRNAKRPRRERDE
jgi:ATP-dependent RNA helicase DeaD